MSANILYTDLSAYYDLLCTDIDYYAQSASIKRLNQLFGNGGKLHLDLACGTGPHVRHFLDFGFTCSGLDLNQPMLDLAQQRCPEASFSLQDMNSFNVSAPQDLITCFLYSLHYSGNINNLKTCLQQVHHALAPSGVFCFNAVDKNKIDNHSAVTHTATHQNSQLTFTSNWYYSGAGDTQALQLRIEKSSSLHHEMWRDEHPMVAFDFKELEGLLAPYFHVHTFEHDYQKIIPLSEDSGNGIFVCVKR